MDSIIRCPICKHNAKWKYWTGTYGIEEEYIDCPTCGYYYQFVYGASSEIVGNKWFIWDYTAKSGDPVFKRMKKAEFMARRRWKKFRKGITCKDYPF